MRYFINATVFLLFILTISDGLIYAQSPPRWKWARTGTEATVDLSVSDTLGNTIVFGKFTTPDFSIGNVRTSGLSTGEANNLYIAKYTSTGSLIWLKSIAGIDASTVLNPVKVMVNTRGEITILGKALNTPEVRIDNTTVKFTNRNEQMFVAKFHKAGRLLWARIVQVTGGQGPSVAGNDLFLNEAGEVFVTGQFTGDSALFNLKLLRGDNIDPLFFLVKYNPLGLVDWAVTCDYNKGGDNGTIAGLKVAVNGANEAVVAGEFYGYKTFYFGNDTLMPRGGTDIFIVQYSPDGTYMWSKTIQGTLEEKLDRLLIDNNQNILVDGLYSSDVLQVIDQDIPNSSNGFDLFIAQIKPGGGRNWVQNIDIKLQTLDFQGLKSMLHVDELSDVYVASIFQGAEVLTNTLVQANKEPGTPDLIFVKLENATGNPIWSRSAAAVGENLLNAVTFDRFSNLYFTTDINSGNATVDISEIKDTIGFGGNYVARINRFGNVSFMKPVLNKDSVSSVSIKSLSVDYFGNLYVSGVFSGTNNSLDGLPLSTAKGIYTAKYAYVTNITGSVKNAEGIPVNIGYVKLYGFTRFQRSPISDSVAIESDGSYLFKNIPFGRYIIYAKPQEDEFPGALPAYYPEAGHWTDALPVTVNSTIPIEGIDIIINKPDLPPGDGSMGGNISEVDSIASLKSSLSILKQPAKEVSVILINRQKSTGGDVVAEVYTDSEGNFIITGVPDGDYTLIADIPGLPHAGTYFVSISGGQYIGNLDYEVGLEEIYPLYPTGISGNVEYTSVNVYPNPCYDNLTVDLSGFKGHNVRIEIYSISGQLYKKEQIIDSGSPVHVDIEDLDRGIYVIKIYLPDNPYVKKLIKL